MPRIVIVNKFEQGTAPKKLVGKIKIKNKSLFEIVNGVLMRKDRTTKFVELDNRNNIIKQKGTDKTIGENIFE